MLDAIKSFLLMCVCVCARVCACVKGPEVLYQSSLPPGLLQKYPKCCASGLMTAHHVCLRCVGFFLFTLILTCTSISDPVHVFEPDCFVNRCKGRKEKKARTEVVRLSLRSYRSAGVEMDGREEHLSFKYRSIRLVVSLRKLNSLPPGRWCCCKPRLLAQELRWDSPLSAIKDIRVADARLLV